MLLLLDVFLFRIRQSQLSLRPFAWLHATPLQARQSSSGFVLKSQPASKSARLTQPFAAMQFRQFVSSVTSRDIPAA